jgi:hypothetical protein
MFRKLLPELIALVESFHEVPYWKGRFSEDVLPRLNKGWRLAGIAHDGDFCFDCLRKDCEFELDHMNYDWVSGEETFALLNPEPVTVLSSAVRMVLSNLARTQQYVTENAYYDDYSDEENNYEDYSDEESSDEED